jgi:hypothetical protein
MSSHLSTTKIRTVFRLSHKKANSLFNENSEIQKHSARRLFPNSTAKPSKILSTVPGGNLFVFIIMIK